MKKHFLFIPDIFLVMLIVFSCERIDLTEWRNSTDNFPYTNETSTNLNSISLDTPKDKPEDDIWKNQLAEYKERAKFIFTNFRIKIGEN